VTTPPLPEYPIPGRLNLLLAALQLITLPALLIGAQWVTHWWALALLAIAYALVMNSAYCLLHEAEHGLLHPHPRLNATTGALLALFFPAPFHLLRQGHIGHHQRNRSDDEAFDFYFEGESPTWKRLQFYGILTGMFYLVVVAGGLLSLLIPAKLIQRRQRSDPLDRPTAALLESLNPAYMALIRLEAAGVIALHVALPLLLGAVWWRHLLLLVTFGCLWSALQYVHHFGTVRDVRWGTRNLRTWGWLDRLWLNHNWHLNHHLHPTVPWTYLPRLTPPAAPPREALWPAMCRMLRGPRYTTERVENRFAGRIIR
jgi:fatty acid desaturase